MTDTFGLRIVEWDIVDEKANHLVREFLSGTGTDPPAEELDDGLLPGLLKFLGLGR